MGSDSRIGHQIWGRYPCAINDMISEANFLRLWCRRVNVRTVPGTKEVLAPLPQLIKYLIRDMETMLLLCLKTNLSLN